MGRLAAALLWFEEFGGGNPKDAELQVRLAQVTVWSGAYAKGLDRLEKVLNADFQQPVLWPTYVDAASGAPSMTETQRELALAHRYAATFHQGRGRAIALPDTVGLGVHPGKRTRQGRRLAKRRQ